MKTLIVFGCMAVLVVSLNACNKNAVDPTSTDGSARSSSVSSGTVTGPHSLTAIDVSSLPATVTTYISTNYAGATIKDVRKDDQGNYLVAISVNSTIKLLVFAANGTFVKELSGKPGHMHGDSTHHMPGDSTHHHMPGDSTHMHPPKDSTHFHPPATQPITLCPVIRQTILDLVGVGRAGMVIKLWPYACRRLDRL